MLLVLITMLIMVVKVIIYHPFYMSVLKKELKIKGQIGYANQKDKLTYVSLIHQTDEAQEAGYKESEIVSIVIRVWFQA